MLEELNSVSTTVAINGQTIPVVKLMLEQEFNHHHKFEILLNYEVLEKKWMMQPRKVLSLIEGEVAITFLHLKTGVRQMFYGIIFNVSYVGRSGKKNQILVSGYSPSILLDENKTLDSFTNKTLKNIVNEAIQNTDNDVIAIVNPVFSSTINYFCQYNESCFEFLNKLSWIYGEWFYYNGQSILFGKPEELESIKLVYGANCSEIDFSATIQPVRFSMYDYLERECSEVSSYTLKDDIEVVGYAKPVLNSDKLL